MLEDLLKKFPRSARSEGAIGAVASRDRAAFGKRQSARTEAAASTPANTTRLQRLKRFPAEGVGGEILQGVREMTQDYETREAR